jgi:hypothetical protein
MAVFVFAPLREKDAGQKDEGQENGRRIFLTIIFLTSSPLWPAASVAPGELPQKNAKDIQNLSSYYYAQKSFIFARILN